MATILVKKGNDFFELPVGNEEYRFVEGTEENLVVSVRGLVFKRYPRSYRYGGRKDYYEFVNVKPNTAGYLQVNVPVRNTTDLVHRLVAETFLSNPKGYNEIDHINHNKLDNSVANLRYCTHSGNMQNSDKPKVKIFWKDITAVSLDTDEVYEFSKFRDITPVATLKGWGEGWGTAIRRKLENGGTAYGFFWSAKKKEVIAL